MPSLNPFTSNLTQQQVAHLLRRTTFGPTKQEIDSFTGKPVGDVLTEIFTEYDTPLTPPIDPATGMDWVSPKPDDTNSDSGDLENFLMSWWLDHMRTKGTNITERMVFFFHTHFTTKRTKVNNSVSLYHQMALFRHYALGNFKLLAKKICTDNAMIVFLDGRSNVFGSPQENFARELLELFTIGKGEQTGPEDYTTYTETDVQEAAKVLSGYDRETTFGNIDPDTMIPRGIIKTNTNVLPQDPAGRATQHDESVKTFNGSLGNGGTTIQPANLIGGETADIESVYGELDELIDMIFAKEETAKFICRDIYRFFVHYCITDEIENDIIVPMANTFRDNDYEIKPVLEQLFRSQHFFDADNTVNEDDTKGGLIKSPLELTIGTMRFFDLDFGDTSDLTKFYSIYRYNIFPMLRDQGLVVYEPFEVAGYEAYHQFPEYNRHWITASNLGYRYQLIDLLILGFTDEDNNPLGVKLDVLKLVENTNYVADPTLPNDIVDFFVDHLFTQGIRNERYEYFRDQILLDTLSIANWENEWAMYLSSGDDTSVRIQIEALVREMIQSPEYQLF